MEATPISTWYTNLGHVKVDLFANPHRFWNGVPEHRSTMHVSINRGMHADGTQFLQIWLCPPHMISKGTSKKSLVVIDERLESWIAYSAFLVKKAASDSDPRASFPQTDWDSFWYWFSQDADLTLVQSSNGSESLLLTEGTAWMWQHEGEPVYLLHGHTLKEDSYNYVSFTIDRKARGWSWELDEHTGYEHNLYRITLTTANSPELITVIREDREDIYEEDPNASEDSTWPFTDNYETVYHKRTFKLMLGSTYKVIEVQSETQE